MTMDERILRILAAGQSRSHLLSDAMQWNDRSVRRRLRRLIRDGYVFSPERGAYRITRSGRAVLEDGEAVQPRPGILDATPRDLVDRLTQRGS